MAGYRGFIGRAILAFVGVVVGSGCAPAEPLAGVDLPPASMPDEVPESHWAVAFSHRFEPEAWSEGPHVYRMTLDCPDALEEGVETELVFFAADPEQPEVDGIVYLRATGLSTTSLGGIDMGRIAPSQETEALLTVVGMPEAEAMAATACVGQIEFDTGVERPLEPGDPFRP